jgi:hypothetical protein
MDYQFTDVGRSEIYVYSFETEREYQVSNFGNQSGHSPVFLQDNIEKRVSFLRYADLINSFRTTVCSLSLTIEVRMQENPHQACMD